MSKPGLAFSCLPKCFKTVWILEDLFRAHGGGGARHTSHAVGRRRIYWIVENQNADFLFATSVFMLGMRCIPFLIFLSLKLLHKGSPNKGLWDYISWCRPINFSPTESRYLVTEVPERVSVSFLCGHRYEIRHRCESRLKIVSFESTGRTSHYWRYQTELEDTRTEAGAVLYCDHTAGQAVNLRHQDITAFEPNRRYH